MKKISIMYLMITLVMFCTISVYAISNDLYSIELVDGFSETGKNCFSDSEGNTINIVLTTLENTKGFDYTDEYLDNIISQANNLKMSSLKKEMEQQIKDTYGDSLTDEFIQQYLESIKIDGVLKKGIDKVGKNAYECFYYRTQWSLGEDYSYFVDSYQVVSGKKIYTVTASGTKEFLESKKAKDMLGSFEITNFKPVEKESVVDDMVSASFSGMLEAFIIMLIFGGFGAIFGRKKKNTNSVDVKQYIDQSKLTYSDDVKVVEDENEIDTDNITQEDTLKYCNECGEEIEQAWEFCNNCGAKILKKEE